IDDVELQDYSAKYRDPQCRSDIAATLAAGGTMLTVMSVYEADYKVVISYDTSASADAQATITSELALKLGLKDGDMGTDTITGAGLFWGYTSEPVTSP